MLGYMLNRLLVYGLIRYPFFILRRTFEGWLLLAYLYPAYECFKSIEKNKPDVEQLRFWCQYWIIIAAMTVWDPFGDALIGWLPMYSETKLVICVYLWYPKTQGTKYIYESFLKPYISKHEPEIDRTLSEFKTRAGDSAALYFQRVLAYVQTRSFDLLQVLMSQSIQRPPPQEPQTNPDIKASAATSSAGKKSS